MKRAVVLAIVLAIACSRRAPIASCEDDLRGVYVAGGERWMMLDRGETLEAYPLFPDGVGAPDGAPAAGSAIPLGSTPDPDGVVIAPRMIDFTRSAASSAAGPSASGPSSGDDPELAAASRPLAGTLRRRYMRRAEGCEAHVPVHVTRCAGDTLELVLADPSPPIAYAPCTWPRPGPSRVVRWRRE
jgi:hypothetical protein